MSQSSQPRRRQTQPLDRVSLIVMALLALIIAGMLLVGAQVLPRVRTFSWQDQQVSAEDIAFLLTFTQPMTPESVENNLQIEPELAGKFSWAGRKMAYTLEAAAPYGERFKISLPTAESLTGQPGFEAFESEFQTRDRVFAYIGVEGEEQGRLVLFNLTQKEKTLLTAEGQAVLDFQPYPERDRILFSAVAVDDSDTGVASAQLYNVSTGLGAPPDSPRWQFWQKPEVPKAGQIQLVLDNRDYQNLKFDLAPNGSTIVVQRVNNENPSDFGPWVIEAEEAPRKLNTEPGGDFKIAPDSLSLLLQQGKGTAVIDLENNPADAQSSGQEDELLDFLPEYGLTLDLASDGSRAALVNFNQDDPEKRFTQSLFLVSNTGEETSLLQTNGSILSAQFNENNEILYCLVNELLQVESVDEENESAPDTEQDGERGDVADNETESGSDEATTSEDPRLDEELLLAEEALSLSEDVFSFIPQLIAVNVKTGRVQKLLEMPPQPEINMSLSPDGLAVLFDEVLVSDGQSESKPSDFAGPTHRLWLLPVFSTLEERVSGEPIPLPPTELDIAGRQPVWLP
ncbi:MAG: hypothetical protein AAFO83_03675 [Cyanobacteria bacterium J06607_13]